MTSTDQPDVVKNANASKSPTEIKPFNPDQFRFGARMKIIPMNDQIKELQTIIRDRNTTRSEFVFYADRLIRIVVEEGLNQLSYSECAVTTPTGSIYQGIKFLRGSCGVSIVRSGEAMEQGLRDCCLDVHSRKVLLMYPIMSTGNTVNKAVEVLKDHGVQEENIFLLNLFCTPHAAKSVMKAFPTMTVLTSELHPVAPNHFGQKYFGTD
ncbi:hypothetical protein HPB51_011031 [Rhipicephalus microplus]|uniref:Phosphoribosyltransferase domain-containing protein n=1 Tax=Rhipicephalus microplus TaxID=6941 RepID=A0A9J6DFU1_RHIMP|nr:hypothetical protein HPB51_011031 [Rhipicephalus microplus]